MHFDEAVEIILEFESEYVDDPRDPGGKTKFGISQRAYPNLDILNLTQDEAKEIYRRDYWDKLCLDELPEMLRLPLFDCAVNQGLKFTIRTIQFILGVKTDGVFGIETMSALLQFNDLKKIHNEFILRRFENYASQKTWIHFGAGWSRRLLKVALST